jgi:hypothetical protein
LAPSLLLLALCSPLHLGSLSLCNIYIYNYIYILHYIIVICCHSLEKSPITQLTKARMILRILRPVPITAATTEVFTDARMLKMPASHNNQPVMD